MNQSSPDLKLSALNYLSTPPSLITQTNMTFFNIFILYCDNKVILKIQISPTCLVTLLTIVNYRLQMPNIAYDAYFTYSTEITLSLSTTYNSYIAYNT